MQFQTPQFIEIEDKVVGPFSFRQFAYLAGAAGAVAIFYALTGSLYFALILGSPFVLFAVALAFYKVNDRPFIYAVEAALRYALSKKLYRWKHEQKTLPKKEPEKAAPALSIPRLSQNKLKDIAWSLDIQESIYSKKPTTYNQPQTTRP